MIIDNIKEDDPKKLAALDKKCFEVPWSQKSFEDEFKNDIAYYFIAREGDEIIGYAGFWNVSGEGDITNIAVDERYRRRYIGSALLETLIKKAVSLKIELLTLEVRKSNIAAQRLYAKYGFEEIGIRKGYYSNNREDALIMTKTLQR